MDSTNRIMKRGPKWDQGTLDSGMGQNYWRGKKRDGKKSLGKNDIGFLPWKKKSTLPDAFLFL